MAPAAALTPPEGPLLGANLEAPTPGSAFPGFTIALSGWAIGRASALTSVEIDAGETSVSVPLDRPRPDVAAAYPQVRVPGEHGFLALLPGLDLANRFELALHARFDDGTRSRLWTVVGRRTPVARLGPGPMRPVLVSTSGRTGSTWLLRLLEEHPEIVAYRPFAYEPRVASYWMEVLRAIANPRSYEASLRPRVRPGWWIESHAPPEPLPADDVLVESVLARRNAEELAAFGRGRTLDFYAAVAAQSGKAPVCFAEKGAWQPHVWRLLYEVYPDLRDIHLVRDPRDVLCSMLAYDARLGQVGFGRDAGARVEDFPADLRRYLLKDHRGHTERGEGSQLVRYEDLVTRPAETLARVFAHLRVAASPEVVAGVLDRALADTRAPDFHRTSGDDPAASIGRWRRDLTGGLRDAALRELHEVVRLYGYEEQ